jgi:tight adherence protein B
VPVSAPVVAGTLAAASVLAVRAAWTAHAGEATRRVSSTRPVAPVVPHLVTACCAAADLDLEPAVVWRWYRAALLAGPALVLLATSAPLAVGALAALIAGPRFALPFLQRRRDERRDSQLTPFLERVASSIRSGRSVRSALTEVARGMDRPLRTDLEPLADALDHGAALEDAVDRWAGTSPSSSEVRLAAAALRLGARAGGEVARAVDGVAASLRERREVRGELIALATQARTSALLLVVAPLGFAGLMSTVEPGAIRFLLGTPLGLLCLTAGLVLDAAGGWWMQRIVGRAR